MKITAKENDINRRFSTYGPWPSSGPWRCVQWATELFYHKLKIACYSFSFFILVKLTTVH